mmetsp:Transcript_63965/g.198554  ORF Transcript_63965/g.198554 Transcript_63965/m.198554 type:complete len:210 (-) Transcript_63965:456-1085(-)
MTAAVAPALNPRVPAATATAKRAPLPPPTDMALASSAARCWPERRASGSSADQRPRVRRRAPRTCPRKASRAGRTGSARRTRRPSWLCRTCAAAFACSQPSRSTLHRRRRQPRRRSSVLAHPQNGGRPSPATPLQTHRHSCSWRARTRGRRCDSPLLPRRDSAMGVARQQRAGTSTLQGPMSSSSPLVCCRCHRRLSRCRRPGYTDLEG